MWIARDKDGTLFLYDNKPKKLRDYWDSQRGYAAIELPSSMFINIDFENSPKEVKLELVEEDPIIEKACKWLDDNLYTTYDMFNNTGVDSVNYHTVEEFIEEFKKAMYEKST